MAWINRIPEPYRRHASGMPPGLVAELSQRELNERMAEVERIKQGAVELPADLYRLRIAKAEQVRDSMPWPEFVARLKQLNARLDGLPGTGLDALAFRQNTYEEIAELKAQHVYPEAVKTGSNQP